MIAYTITVHNEQGASEQHKANTRGEIARWLAKWADPQNLTARVVDSDGNVVARKDRGRKTLLWTSSTAKLVWLYQGIADMGDERGEIRLYVTTCAGSKIRKTVARGGRKIRYTVTGQDFRRLADARQAVR